MALNTALAGTNIDVTPYALLSGCLAFVRSTHVFRIKATLVLFYSVGVDIVSDRLSGLHHVIVTNSAHEMKCALTGTIIDVKLYALLRGV